MTAALAREQVLVADLRLEQRTLDDAFLALTGRSLDADGDADGDPDSDHLNDGNDGNDDAHGAQLEVAR